MFARALWGTGGQVVRSFSRSPRMLNNPNLNPHTHKVNNLEKRFLVWTGKYKTVAEVPNVLAGFVPTTLNFVLRNTNINITNSPAPIPSSLHTNNTSSSQSDHPITKMFARALWGTGGQVVRSFSRSPRMLNNPNLNPHTHKVNNLEKRFLVWTGKYKTVAEVPNVLAPEIVDKARNRMRIRVANLMMVGTLFACLGVAISGKRAHERGESVQKQNLEWHRKIKEDAQAEEEAKLAKN